MKKLMKVFLMVTLCLSVCACDHKSEGEPYLSLVKDDEYCLNFSSQKAYEKSIKKVEVTDDNWREYFEDYTYKDTIIKMNENGEEVREEVLFIGFGLKKDYLGHVDEVSFKIDSYAKFESDSFGYDELDNLTYDLYELHNLNHRVYSYKSDTFIKEEPTISPLKLEMIEENNVSFFNLSMNTDFQAGIQLKNAICYGVEGVLYLIDVPAGVYNGENVVRVNFGYGEIGFATDNIKMFYKEENNK